MTGVDISGAMRTVEPRPTRWARRAPGIAELIGDGPDADRNGLIVLAAKHNWSYERLAAVFRLSPRHVRRIVQEFRQRVTHGDS